MTHQENKSSHESLVAVSDKLFEIIIEELNVSTAYIARKDRHVMTVVNSYNRDEEIVPKEYDLDYEESNCKLVLQAEDGSKSISNLMQDVLTKDRRITEELQVKGFLGVTLRSVEGDVFGTLCVMDKKDKQFSEQNLQFLKTMAGVLSYVIELDETFMEMELLSVPIIPIADKIAVLALQGNVSKARGIKILEDTMEYATSNKVNYFIIDLSQMRTTDERFTNLLNRLVSALRIMGVRVMLTAVPVELANQDSARDHLNTLDVEYVQNIQSALKKIGYILKAI